MLGGGVGGGDIEGGVRLVATFSYQLRTDIAD